jgi:hypothetical protein
MSFPVLELHPPIHHLSGSQSASWRHSSEPMDPPAPVTNTRLPRTKRRVGSHSSYTGTRSSRSSIERSRI